MANEAPKEVVVKYTDGEIEIFQEIVEANIDELGITIRYYRDAEVYRRFIQDRAYLWSEFAWESDNAQTT